MNLGERIKENRERLILSQEVLADKIYVSRQTISNWENNKNYPDINSLLLLSNLFDVSLDTLVKGDLLEIKAIANQNNNKDFKKLSNLFAMMMAITIISAVPLFYFLDIVGIILWIIIMLLTAAIALKVEKEKKKYDVQTYKEILAFMEGKELNQIDKYKESGKKGYQKMMLSIASALITVAVCLLLMKLFNII